MMTKLGAAFILLLLPFASVTDDHLFLLADLLF